MKRKTSLGILLGLVLLLLTGCGRPKTPEEVWSAYREAAYGRMCTQVDMTVELRLSMELPALGSYHRVYEQLRLDASTTVARTPFVSKTDVTAALHHYSPEVDMDQRTRLNSQVYTLMQDGKTVRYTNGEDGRWTRTEVDLDPEAMVMSADALLDGAKIQWDRTVTQWEGTAAHCLTATVPGEAALPMLKRLLKDMEPLTDRMGTLSLTPSECGVRLYLDAKTCLPLAQEFTVTMAQVPDREVDFEACTATLRYRSFDTQPPIELPQEARENAQRWERLLSGNPDNGDGTFTIREGDALVDITVPQGWEPAGGNGYSAAFAPENEGVYVVYEMQTVNNDPDMSYFTEQADSLCQSARENGMEPQRETTQLQVGELSFTCDSITVQTDSGEKQYLFIWAPVKQTEGMTRYVTVTTLGRPGQEKRTALTMDQITLCVQAVKPSTLMQ
ncbi:MAG: hypothetical protein Q4F17_04400 [Eubacteriales bacterium]|nr:hypothetical protein [Eubacteriales bacterium]